MARFLLISLLILGSLGLEKVKLEDAVTDPASDTTTDTTTTDSTTDSTTDTTTDTTSDSATDSATDSTTDTTTDSTTDTTTDSTTDSTTNSTTDSTDTTTDDTSVTPAIECPIYVCSPNVQDTCYSAVDSTYTVYECADDRECIFSVDSASVTCTAEVDDDDDDDITCPNRIGRGESCSQDEYCRKDFYCEMASSTCQEKANEDKKCSDLYGCEKGTVCNLGSCVEYFSVLDGSSSDSNLACRSAIVKNGVCQPKQATVVVDDDDENESDDEDEDDDDFDGIKECTSDSDCTASDGVTPGSCVCGYNKDGKAYCLPHRSDEISKKLLAASYEWDFGKMAYVVHKYNNYVLLKNIDMNDGSDDQDCLDNSQEIEESDRLKDQRDECSSAALLALFATVILIN